MNVTNVVPTVISSMIASNIYYKYNTLWWVLERKSISLWICFSSRSPELSRDSADLDIYIYIDIEIDIDIDI